MPFLWGLGGNSNSVGNASPSPSPVVPSEDDTIVDDDQPTPLRRRGQQQQSSTSIYGTATMHEHEHEINKSDAHFGSSCSDTVATATSLSSASALTPVKEQQRQLPREQRQRQRPPNFGHHEAMVESLRYTVWDLVALSAEDKSFHQLQRSLRKNGAVTNGMLKQGLPLFLHKNREVILKRYLKEMDRQQDLLDEAVCSDILGAGGIALPTNATAANSGGSGNGWSEWW